jgi:GlpG protein
MRQIGRLEDEAQARRFRDFLYSKNIENQVDPASDGSWEIWVLDESRLEEATSFFERFAKQPDDSTFIQGAGEGARQRHRDRQARAPKRARIVDGRTAFYKPPVGYGVLTMALIAISVIVALMTNLGKNDRIVAYLSITHYSVDGNYLRWDSGLPEIRHGQIWRVFTPMFVHFGLLHIFFNMLWLRDLGSMIETRKGTWMLLALVLVISGLSNVGQYLYSGPTFGGMSGVVYGLLGYIWMQGKFDPASGLELHPQTVTLMIIWFFLCLVGVIPNVANVVHAVGAVVGITWGFLAARVAAWRRHH